MKLIYDIEEHKPYIVQSLKKYGGNVEHNFDYWMYISRKDRPNVFVDFGNNKGLLARCHTDCDNWHILGDPLAPRKEWFAMVYEFTDYVFKRKKAKKNIC